MTLNCLHGTGLASLEELPFHALHPDSSCWLGAGCNAPVWETPSYTLSSNKDLQGASEGRQYTAASDISQCGILWIASGGEERWQAAGAALMW